MKNLIIREYPFNRELKDEYRDMREGAFSENDIYLYLFKYTSSKKGFEGVIIFKCRCTHIPKVLPITFGDENIRQGFTGQYWKIVLDRENNKVSMTPSVGSCTACKCHFFLTDNDLKYV